MSFVVVSVAEPAAGIWLWVSFLLVPMVMGLIRYEHKPKIRRLLAAAVVALTLAVALSAEDDLVIPDPCTVCEWGVANGTIVKYSLFWWINCFGC